jgi:hypothetical protein
MGDKPQFSKLIGVYEKDNSILLAEVVDCELLLFVHPSGHCDQQEPERVENSGASSKRIIAKQ